jgi:4-amino-4-deoxy-L-arabinose transferase-like glycosyltransferase
MARRRSSDGAPRRKKGTAEARAERITWALMVLVFAIVQLLPGTLPNYFVPFAGALILLGSGFYQYARRWPVSPVTWIGGALMAFFAYYNFTINPAQSFQGEVLIVFFAVIILGILTGET